MDGKVRGGLPLYNNKMPNRILFLTEDCSDQILDYDFSFYSCDASMPSTTISITSLEELLTTLTTKITIPNTTPKVTTSSTAVTSTRPTVTSTAVTSPPTTVTIPTTTTPIPSTTVPSTTTAVTRSKTKPTTSTTKITTVSVTTPSTSTILTTTKRSTTPQTVVATEKEIEETTPFITTTEMPKLTTVYQNTTFVTTSTLKATSTTEEVTRRTFIKPVLSTQALETTTATEPTIIVRTIPSVNIQQVPTEVAIATEMPKTTVSSTTLKHTHKTETTKKETTIRIIPTTTKFKPKEIWIRPAQKGESPIVETKIKMSHEFPRYRSANNKELPPAVTTPKTIIVSIIPTSVSYSTFKKIALTSSYITTKNATNSPSNNKTDYGLTTRPMPPVTTKLPIISSTLSTKEVNTTPLARSTTSIPSTSVTLKMSTTKTTSVTKTLEVTKTIPNVNRTNSMTTDINRKTSPSITTTSPNTIKTTQKRNDLLTISTTKSLKYSTTVKSTTERTTKHFTKHVLSTKPTNFSSVTNMHKTTKTPSKVVEKEIKKANVTKTLTKATTEGPEDDEEFHILTEPEHITAVMGDKATERSSVDLVSVISIAGGVMMAVITVAVIIVMIERCKKPRYEDVRKINDIRMQVMIDNNDVPPPYVRSIFHTPLPGKNSFSFLLVFLDALNFTHLTLTSLINELNSCFS